MSADSSLTRDRCRFLENGGCYDTRLCYRDFKETASGKIKVRFFVRPLRATGWQIRHPPTPTFASRQCQLPLSPASCVCERPSSLARSVLTSADGAQDDRGKRCSCGDSNCEVCETVLLKEDDGSYAGQRIQRRCLGCAKNLHVNSDFTKRVSPWECVPAAQCFPGKFPRKDVVGNRYCARSPGVKRQQLPAICDMTQEQPVLEHPDGFGPLVSVGASVVSICVTGCGQPLDMSRHPTLSSCFPGALPSLSDINHASQNGTGGGTVPCVCADEQRCKL